MNLSFWNIRGLNKSPKQHLVRQHIVQNHLSFIALLETKINKVNLPAITKKIAINWKWISNVTDTDKARILILWDPDIWNIQVDFTSSQHITCSVNSIDGRINCIISSIYGLNHQESRKILWTDLLQMHQKAGNTPWLLCGDFNTMINADEKIGGIALTDADTHDFNSFIDNSNLLHLKTLGCFFTWSNKQDQNSRIWCRLDRALVNESWIDKYNSSHVEYLLPTSSDHSPALIKIYEEEKQGKKPFKFFNMWTKHSSYLHTVNSIWQLKVKGYTMFSVVTKLKLLRGALKDLNRKHFGNISEKVQRAKYTLEDVQKKLQEDPFNQMFISQEKNCLSEYNKLLNCELSFYQQKARIHWSIKGDRCTSYFHSIIKSNRHLNRVSVLNNSMGERLTEGGQIINEFISYYRNLMGTSVPSSSPDIRII
ncbi:uncharacterized protein LOC109834843 [Asparagus officinalis]|uniref:uncharacterized protein LOC109834843 n=1 Tax=Asparagus officinalis TaxID=4686 RepID=UPI00098E377C|nr:uncharacterized protein LOC109834843 [Asparagus officinalis]